MYRSRQTAFQQTMRTCTPVIGISSLTLALLTACGGGDDLVADGPLTPFAGTWVASCSPIGERDKLLLEVVAEGKELKVQNETDYFQSPDCSGTAGATLYYRNSSIIGRAQGTAPVSLPTDDAQMRTAQMVDLSVTPGNPNIRSSGLDVSYTFQSLGFTTKKEWCILGVAGQVSYCFDDEDVALSKGSTAVALLRTDSTLYVYQDDDMDGSYALSGTYSRVP
jgi:hypothetical protein